MGLLDGWTLDPNDPSSSGAGTGSLLNPKVLPLLYAAAAAGQAATPSRLPVPLGSVMGQIAGGLGAGMQAGQQGLLSQQELYGRQTQNALNALTLQGYRRLQADNGGNPATAGGALAASMSPGGAASPVPSSATTAGAINPSATPGGADLAFQPPPGSYLAKLASFESFESSGNPNAQNPKSSAVGPYQFTSGTWDDVYKKYVGPRGLPNDPTDPTASAIGAAAYASENAPVLSNALNRSPQESELAMAHFLGASGAVRMLQGNPARPATDFGSTQAVAANPNIFYKPDGTNRTAGEVRAIFDQKFGAGASGTAPVSASGGAVTPRPSPSPSNGASATGIPGLTAPGVMGGGTTAPSVYASAPPSLLNQPGQGSVLAGSPQTAGSPATGGLLGGPNTSAAPQPAAAPLFDMPSLYRQYRQLVAIPGMAPVAQQILGLIQKGLPEGAVLLSDGSVAPRQGYNNFVFAKSMSDKGYQPTATGTWALNPAIPAGEAATAGAKAYATLGPDVLKELSSRAGNPIRLGPNETVESGFAALPQPAQDAILHAIGGRGGPSPSTGPSAPPAVTQPGASVGGFNLGSAPSAVTGQPLNAGAPGASGPRTPQSFGLPTLFGASNDLPAPPRAQPFPTTPIRNPDGSITSPYSTSTTGLQEEANKAYGVAHDQFNAGQIIQQRLAMIDHGIDLLNQSGWSSTGVGAQTKLEGLKAVNSFLTSIDAPPLSNPQKIGGFEDLLKETGNLGLDRARAMGSREAAQVVQLSIGLNPGVGNTYQGAKAIEASMGAAAQRDVDYYKFATQYAQQNHTTFGADTAFNQLRPPELYARRAIAAIVPQVAISSLMNPPQGAPADLAAQFDQKYGRGMAAFIVNGTLDGMPYTSGSASVGNTASQGPQAPRFVGAGPPLPPQ